MKLFLVLLFVGYVSASFQDALEKASNDAILSFMQGVEQAQPLHLALGIENHDAVQRFERDIKDDLKKRLTKLFEETLKKIDDAMKDGKEVNEVALKGLKHLKDKMDDLQIDESEIEKFEKTVDEHLQKILKEMNILPKRSIEEDPMYSVFEDLSFRNFFLKVKQMILDKMDVDNVKNGLAKAVGQVSQSLCEWLTNKGKEKVINFFDRILEADENPQKRSVQGYFEDLETDFRQKIQLFKEWLKNIIEKGLQESKNEIENVRSLAEKRSVDEYLESLKVEFEKKIELFREWLKNVVNKVNNKSENQIQKRSIKEYLELLDKEFEKKLEFYKNWLKDMVEKSLDMSKSKVENLRNLAREILSKTKYMSKTVAEEALEFLRQYREELGYMYEVVRSRLMDKISEYTD